MVEVLLSADEGRGSLAAVRALHAGGFRTSVATWRDDTYAARSRAAAAVVFVTSPYLDPARHAEDLAEQAERLGVAAVLPGSEGSLISLCGRQEPFPGSIAVGAPSRLALDRATDKQLLGELAIEAGLEVPPTVVVESESDPLGDLTYPAIVKPAQTVVDGPDGSLLVVGAEVADGERELRQVIREAPGRLKLVQPHLDATLSAVSGVADQGEVVCTVHQRSPRIWPLRCGITAYAMTVPRDKPRDEAVRKLIRLIGWSGIFEAQFLTTGGRSLLIDLNPRIYGSIGLAIGAGANLPAIWAAGLLGRRVEPPGYRVGTHYRAEESDFRVLWNEAANRRWRTALRGLLPRPRTVHAVFSARDPAPSIVSAGKLIWRRRRAQSARARRPSIA